MSEIEDQTKDWTPPKGCRVIIPAEGGRNGLYRKVERNTSRYEPHQGSSECARRRDAETKS